MQDTIWDKYARVLVDYSTNVQKGDLVQIRGTSVYAKDLVKAIYKRVLERGGHPIVRTSIEDLSDTFIKYATDEQLDFPVVYASAKNGIAKMDLADETTDFVTENNV